MIEKLEKLGDRMLGRMVPKVDASAMVCGPWYCGCIAGIESYSVYLTSPCSKCKGFAC